MGSYIVIIKIKLQELHYPTDKLELDGVNSGYFTYQFFKKLSATLHYTVENLNIDCKFNNLQVQKIL